MTYSTSETFNLSRARGGDFGRFRVGYWVSQRPAGSDAKTDPTASYVTPAHMSMALLASAKTPNAERG